MERGTWFVEGANAYSSDGRLYYAHGQVANEVERLLDDDQDSTSLSFLASHRAARDFKDSTWELIGDSIAKNTHMESIDLSDLQFNDEKMSLLFKHLRRTSAKSIQISRNNFGPVGVRCMVSSLRNAPSLTNLDLSGDVLRPNQHMSTECFDLVVESLHEGSIEVLQFCNCVIDDITVLERCTLPHLQYLLLSQNRIQNIPALEHYTNLKLLQLSHNRVGDSGCRRLARLLQSNNSVLEDLHLDFNNITCEGAELLANSIQSESRLESLHLEGNYNLMEAGCRALSKLLCDVTTLESTYNSNHRLVTLYLPRRYMGSELIDLATQINRECRGTDRVGTRGSAGRRKIVEIQLNSSARRDLCQLQGIEYSYDSLFEGIDPLVLPDILASVQPLTELFSMLVATVPLLASIVDRKAVIQEKIEDYSATRAAIDAEYERQISALTAKRLRETSALDDKILRLKGELDALVLEDSGIRGTKVCGGKRKQINAM